MSNIFRGFSSLTLATTSLITSIAISQIPVQSTVALTSSEKFNPSSTNCSKQYIIWLLEANS